MDGLACRALHYVIDRREHHDPLVAWIEFEADLGDVRAGDGFGLGVAIDPAATGYQADEQFILVGPPKRLPEVALRDRFSWEEVAGRRRASDHIDRVNGER